MKDKKYYWLKLKKDFFKRHDIQIIESMPNGKDYVLFYLKLLVESVDHDGSLRFNDTIPYSEGMLATITNTNVDIVRSAMKIFIELKMMDLLEDKTIYMNEIQKMLGTETYWAEQKRKQKQNKLLKNEDFKYIKKISYERLQLPNGKIQYVDNKRYGGNAFIAFELAQGKCEICGTYDDLCIHHMNGYSNDIDDLKVLCRKCHRRSEVLEISPTEIGKSPQNVQSMSNVSNQEIDIEIDKEIEIKAKKNKITKKQYSEFVELTEKEYNRLTDEFGETGAKRLIEILDNYKGANGKKYADDNRAIRNWVVDRYKEETKHLEKGGNWIVGH